ncbi:MAG TPA: phosphate/phosphite/phosphonate ABC transporter substrate-binding protein [Acidiferrobacteraceae bacterium]|nr:phosphate/phosphite/phosphonate ABC transporter substrate-binding protein [Acidiferrobacteraceae bacterium]
MNKKRIIGWIYALVGSLSLTGAILLLIPRLPALWVFLSATVIGLIIEAGRRVLSSGQSEGDTLADNVDAALGRDLTLDPAHYKFSPLLHLVNSLNRYGHSINQLMGKTANQSNGIVLVSRFLTESSQRIIEHAETQAAEATSLATAAEQMTATIRSVARHASQTSDTASRINDAGNQGAENMQAVSQGVDAVSSLFAEVQNVMGRLRQASDEIGKVVDVITGIAEQTNLLALNAAIEAARAGEQGRGFAVVADEVRSLAEKTKSSTLEISSSIVRYQQLTEEVSGAMHQAEDKLGSNVEQSKTAMQAFQLVAQETEKVNDMIHQIAAATEQQATTVEMMAKNVERVATLSQETLTSVKVAHHASADLTQYAKDTETRVERFNLVYFGLVPLEQAISMNKKFAPLCHYISELMGIDLYIRLGHDYNDAVNDIGTGRALISYQTPSTYIDAHRQFGVEPLVVPLQKGQPTYQSAIVTRSDSGINKLDDIKGRKFAFGDEKSTGSKAMPESMLRGAGVGLGDLTHYGFLGSHDNVATAVLQREFAAGGLMLSVAQKYQDKGLKILATSDPIPQFPICAAASMSPADKKKLTEALVNLKDPGILNAMGSDITGFAPSQDKDYDGVRKMLEKLRQ